MEQAERDFLFPSEEYGLAPLWFWNDALTVDHLKMQMREMKDKKIMEFVISSRLGIEIPYLSDAWFDRIKQITEYAKELGMKLWIYDEDNWPSGYAGGKVLRDNPDFCGKHLRKREVLFSTVKEGFHLPEKIVAVAIIGENKRYEVLDADETNRVASDRVREWVLSKIEDKSDWCKVVFYYEDYTLWNPAYSKDYYPDMLNRNATESFIKHTHRVYEELVGEYFGTVIKGFFVDEPGFYNNLHIFPIGDEDTVPWTTGFSKIFEERNHYSLLQRLPDLWGEDSIHNAKARIDFYETLCETYNKNFLGVLKAYCEERKMQLIGHLHMEEFLRYHVATQGNLMASLKELSVIGVDRIDLNAEKIAEKYISSAGHVYGAKRIMSETFALSGHGLSLQQMKRWIDYQLVRGINMIVPHAFYSSIEGERSKECPPSEFYQNPYWKYFAHLSEYAKRLCCLLSQGAPEVSVGLYYPIHNAQVVYNPTSETKVDNMDQEFQNLALALLEAQIDYDIIPDDGLYNQYVEQLKVLIVSQYQYYSKKEMKRLIALAKDGTAIVFADVLPKDCIDETPEKAEQLLNELMKLPNVYKIAPGLIHKRRTFVRSVLSLTKIIIEEKAMQFYLEEPDASIFYMSRKIGNEKCIFVTNEEDQKKDFSFYLPGTLKVRAINPVTKEEVKVSYHHMTKEPFYLGPDAGGHPLYAKGRYELTRVSISMDEFGSMLFFVTKGNEERTYDAATRLNTVVLNQLWKITVGHNQYESSLLPMETLGEGLFTGDLIYEYEVTLPKVKEGEQVYLNVTHVRDCLTCEINGQEIGSCVFAPYQFLITDAIKDGQNSIRLIVTNSLINELEKMPRLSGITGKVWITYEKRI